MYIYFVKKQTHTREREKLIINNNNKTNITAIKAT